MIELTKGPWKCNRLEASCTVDADGPLPDSYFRVAEVSRIHDALVIAACPEMVAALEQFVWAFEQGEKHGSSVQWEDIEDAYGMACAVFRKVKEELERQNPRVS